MGSGYSGKYENTYGSTNGEKNSSPRNDLPDNQVILKKRSTIDENASLVKDKYGLDENGFFGETTKTKSQVFRSNYPVEDSIEFYNKLGTGGKQSLLDNGHGVKTVLDDNTIITHRIVTSTKGSPAVDIHVYSKSFVQTQKIHFISKGG